jgi:hypothetical protein
MKRITLSALFLCLAVYAFAFAETSVKAEVDKLSLSADKFITYKITVASTEKLSPELQLPDFKGFTVVSQGQSSSMSLSTGSVENSIVYAFVLGPQKEGVFTIQPAKVTVGDQVYATDSFEIQVFPAAGSFDLPEIPPSDSQPQKALPEDETSRITL